MPWWRRAVQGYDANGNLTSDQNKKITPIKYNLLNLPEEITFVDNAKVSKVKYIYDASGAKLQKISTTSDGVVTTTDYCGELEFTKTGTGTSSLNLIHTEEGYVSYNGNSTGTYQYFLKDHLGNTRVVINSVQSFIKDPKNDVSFTKAVGDGKVGEVNTIRNILSIAGPQSGIISVWNMLFPTKVDYSKPVQVLPTKHTPYIKGIAGRPYYTDN